MTTDHKPRKLKRGLTSRERLGLTQSQISRWAGVTRKAVRLLEARLKEDHKCEGIPDWIWRDSASPTRKRLLGIYEDLDELATRIGA